MKAMIFAAGLGTRLRPLTDDRPKALVEVNGMTMLERTIRAVCDAGCSMVVVNVHHFADKVIDFLNSRRWSVEVQVSDERDMLLETGGGILAARRYLDGDEPFVVHNADVLTHGFDLAEMIYTHRRCGALATVLVRERVTQRYFAFDDERRLRGWCNVSTGETRPEGLATAGLTLRAFGGIHVCSPEIFPLLEQYAAVAGPKFSTTPFYVAQCTGQLIRGYEQRADYMWYDVGKPDTLRQACEAWAALEC